MKNRELGLLDRIRGRMTALRPSEQRVATAVLDNPELAITRSISVLAREARVSEPTVIRFCRALDCAGFLDFKLALARELGGRLHYANQALGQADTATTLIDKITGAAISGLDELRRQLDPRVLEQAVLRLAGARRVEFCGLGGAGIVAADAQFKFARLGLAAVAYADAYIHNVTASLLGSDDVLVAISNSGRSRDLLKTAELAGQSGATVIVLCPGRSPLAQRADLVLAIETDPDADAFTPIRARVNHLVVIDTLAIGVALRQGPAMHERMNRASAVLSQHFVSASYT